MIYQQILVGSWKWYDPSPIHMLWILTSPQKAGYGLTWQIVMFSGKQSPQRMSSSDVT